MSDDSDLSLEIQITSKDHQFILPNQLLLIKSDSSTTCFDIINSLSNKSILLKHILTFIKHYSISNNNNNDDNNDNNSKEELNKYIEIIASKKEEITSNIPINGAIYPLLNRHKWTLISFLINKDLVIQSKIFLSNNDDDTSSNEYINYDINNNNNNSVTNNDNNEGINSDINCEFEYKRFYNRASPISAFNSLSEIASLYHIFGAVLIIFLSGILTREALEKGVLYRFDLLIWNFGKADKVFLIWSGMFTYSFIFISLFNSYKKRSIDHLNFGVLYILLLLPLLYIPFQLIHKLNLPIASAAVISCEQIRFIMKIHAYIFEMFRACHVGELFNHNYNSGSGSGNQDNKYNKYLQNDWINSWQQCLNESSVKHKQSIHSNIDVYDTNYEYKSNIDHTPIASLNNNIITGALSAWGMKNNNLNIPIVVQIAHLSYNEHVQSFLNFIFCPSLVYRWKYPTYQGNDTRYRVNWNEIFFQMMNMSGCLLFVFVVFYHFLCPSFEDFISFNNSDSNQMQSQFKLSSFISSVFNSAIPGMLLIIMAFFGVIHCWLNMWCELTGFCDRYFYEDWWNCNSFASFARKWNLVVYNWLHNYFFLPMLQGGYSKEAANLFIFLVWASIQEYVLTAISGMFYPVLLVFSLLFGILFYRVTTPNYDTNYLSSSSSLKKLKNNNPNAHDHYDEPDYWHVFLWMTLFLQNGVFVTLYAREWYAYKAFKNGSIQFDETSMLPYSWQIMLNRINNTCSENC